MIRWSRWYCKNCGPNILNYLWLNLVFSRQRQSLFVVIFYVLTLKAGLCNRNGKNIYSIINKLKPPTIGFNVNLPNEHNNIKIEISISSHHSIISKAMKSFQEKESKIIKPQFSGWYEI